MTIHRTTSSVAKVPLDSKLSGAKAASKRASASFGADLLMKSLLIFYKSPGHVDALVNALSRKQISLSKLEWFITNYSMRCNTAYQVNGRPFHVHSNYRRYVNSYGKPKFDTFCRGKLMRVDLGNGVVLDTTVAQLNLFRWAISNNVIEHACQHLNAIERDMADRMPKMPTMSTTTMPTPTMSNFNTCVPWKRRME